MRTLNWYQNQWLDDLERPKCTLAEKLSYEAHQKKNWMKIDPYYQKSTKCWPMILVSRNIRLVRIFAGFPGQGAQSADWQWGYRKRTCLDLSFHRVHANKSPLKLGRKGSVGVSSDCPNFWVPAIISGTGKATNFQFCTHILRSEQKNITDFEKSSRLLVRTLEIFQGTHLLGASRGRLCYSSAFLFR